MLYLAPLSLGVKILCVLGALGLCAIVVYKATESMSQNIQALEVGLLNFKDGEYAATLACSTTDEFAHLRPLQCIRAITSQRKAMVASAGINAR